MKRHRVRLLCFSISLLTSVAYTSVSLADQTTDAINRLMGGYSSNTTLAGGNTSQNPGNWIFPYSWNNGDFAALSTGLGLALAYPSNSTSITPPLAPIEQDPKRPNVKVTMTPSGLEQAILNMMLTPDIQSGTQPLTQYMITSGAVPAPNPTPTTGQGVLVSGGNSTLSVSSGDIASYNAESLLSPTVYQDSTAVNAADNYIQFASGLIQPLGVFTPASDNTTILTNPNYISYLAQIRSYVAAMSVGVGNLYRLYAERMPITKTNQQNQTTAPFNALNSYGLGAIAQLPANSSQLTDGSASALQVDQYSATRRFNDPNWRRGIMEASPTALAREQLYLLAEIRYEMFLSRMEMQRMTVAMSMMQLQLLNGSARAGINQARQALDNPSLAQK